jgi:hypothetical protein
MLSLNFFVDHDAIKEYSSAIRRSYADDGTYSHASLALSVVGGRVSLPQPLGTPLHDVAIAAPL